MISTEAPSSALDFRAIWNRQELTPALEAQAVRIAGAVFEVIVNPQAGLQNVTEWCKKEICWNRTAQLEITLSSSLFKELIDRDEETQQKKDSVAGQKIEVGIERQTAVFQLGANYWKALREWGARQGLLSPDDISVLGVAAAMPRKLPTEKQSTWLMELKTRLEGEGYPVEQAAAEAHSRM